MAAHSLTCTLREAKKNHASRIDLPKDTYHIYADEAATQVVCVSNHGFNGYKSAALSLEGMADLTIDGNGSTFVLIASLLYYFSGSAPGPFCIILMVLFGISASMFRQM